MLIIFDFDGVLYKASWKGLFEAYKAVIKSQGKNYKDFFKNLNEFRKWWNPDWRKNLRKLDIKAEDSDEAHRIFYEISNSYNYLFPWARKIISELSKKHQLAIFTNRHSSNARTLLRPISIYFSCIIGGEDVRRLKPDPEGIYRILAILEMKTRDVLMVGDTPEDILAGKAAGVKTGAVKWGLGDWENLLSRDPDYKFKKYTDLLRI